MNIKTQRIIILGIVIIMLLLSARITQDAAEYDCNKCEVEYKNSLVGQEPYVVGKVAVKELYTEYVQGRCMVTWEEDQGYKIAKKLNS